MRDQEFRRDPRVAHAFLIRYRPPDDAAGGWRVSPLRDLSSRGARFLSEQEFPVGSSLEVQLQLGWAQERIQLKARVAWVRPAQLMKLHEIGVAFDAEGPSTQQALDAAVNRFLKKAKG